MSPESSHDLITQSSQGALTSQEEQAKKNWLAQIDEHLEQIAKTPLRVLVWGPAGPENPLYRKREQIRDDMRALGHAAFFSEELLSGNTQRFALNVIEHSQAMTADLIIVLQASPGSTAEVHDFVYSHDIVCKMLIFIDEMAKDGYSYNGALALSKKLYNNVITYKYPEDVIECHLLGQVLDRISVLQQVKCLGMANLPGREWADERESISETRELVKPIGEQAIVSGTPEPIEPRSERESVVETSEPSKPIDKRETVFESSESLKAVTVFPGSLLEFNRVHRLEIEAFGDPLALLLLKILEYQRKGARVELSNQLDQLSRLIESDNGIRARARVVADALHRAAQEPNLSNLKLNLLTQAGLIGEVKNEITPTLLGKRLLRDAGLTFKLKKEPVPLSLEDELLEKQDDKDINQITYALVTVDYLSDPLSVGSELKTDVLHLCWGKKIPEAIDVCRELSRVGLSAKDTYVQGVAVFLLGAVYFALGSRGNDWEVASDHYRQSIWFFHNVANDNHDHNEGVAWLALARVYEKQCFDQLHPMNRWSEGIDAYSRAITCFEQGQDPLTENTTKHRARLIRKFREQPPYQAIQHENGWNTPHIESTSPPQPIEQRLAETRTLNRKNSRLIPVFLVIGILLLGLGAWLWNLPKQQPVIAMSLLCSGIILMVISFLTLVFSQQIFYTLYLNEAAIVNSGERLWLDERLGRKFLLPFAEHLDALFPIIPRLFHMPSKRFTANDGFAVEVRLTTRYEILNPLLAWSDIVLQNKPREILGIRCPVRGNEIYRILEIRIQKELESILLNLVTDLLHRDVLGTTYQLEQYLAGKLAERTVDLGLQIIQVEVFLRYV